MQLKHEQSGLRLSSIEADKQILDKATQALHKLKLEKDHYQELSKSQARMMTGLAQDFQDIKNSHDAIKDKMMAEWLEDEKRWEAEVDSLNAELAETSICYETLEENHDSACFSAEAWRKSSLAYEKDAVNWKRKKDNWQKEAERLQKTYADFMKRAGDKISEANKKVSAKDSVIAGLQKDFEVYQNEARALFDKYRKEGKAWEKRAKKLKSAVRDAAGVKGMLEQDLVAANKEIARLKVKVLAKSDAHDKLNVSLKRLELELETLKKKAPSIALAKTEKYGKYIDDIMRKYGLGEELRQAQKEVRSHLKK